MYKDISNLTRERHLSAMALADGLKFIGWVEKYEHARSKIVLNCPTHGDIVVNYDGFMKRGTRCIRCIARPGKSSSFRESQIRELIEPEGFEFIGWEGQYKNALTKAIVKCPTHGEWSVTIDSLVHHGRRCPICARKYLIPQAERESQLSSIAVVEGLTFVGWETTYAGCNSRAIIGCPLHGEWCVAITSFVSDGRRCPSCAKTGYDPAKPGTLYALLSACESFIKIGISNKPFQRHAVLRRKTPFKFTVHRELPNTDGAIPIALEKLFHDQFPSAGLIGFDGATEWRQMSPDVTTWLDLLQ
jgi:hypothetical protein